LIKDAALLLLAATAAWGLEAADVIFQGGAILTMNPARPAAEALAVRQGKIVAAGSRAEVMRWDGPHTVHHSLKGATLLPGFIDAHGHFSQQVLAGFLRNLSSPPAGPVRSIGDLQRELLAYKSEHHLRPGEWIFGQGYDDSLLAEHRHPTREELDQVSTENPIFVGHISGHLCVGNSAALKLAGIGPGTQAPAGGTIGASGVLEETAQELLLSKLPRPTLEELLARVEATGQYYAAFGITTVQDGITRPEDLKLLQAAAASDLLKLDVVSYPIWVAAEQLIPADTRAYHGRLRIAGVKMTLDGSPQAKTAYLTTPYLIPPEGRDAAYRGYPIMADEKVNEFVSRFADRGWQILAHCNGDAAADQFIQAIAQTGGQARRPVMIHAQTVREDQLDQMRDLGIIPSFFVAHTFYWGDWHRDSVLGKERAYRISPAASAAKRGMRFTFHNDSPVVPPDMLRLLWTGVNRLSRSGDVIGPDQRVSIQQALKAVTIDAAYQYFEEDTKGSLETGKTADLVILSKNPLTIDPKHLQDIRVLETIKEGVIVYQYRP
jgi:predicted amidohydrolase YtcJ